MTPLSFSTQLGKNVVSALINLRAALAFPPASMTEHLANLFNSTFWVREHVNLPKEKNIEFCADSGSNSLKPIRALFGSASLYFYGNFARARHERRVTTSDKPLSNESGTELLIRQAVPKKTLREGRVLSKAVSEMIATWPSSHVVSPFLRTSSMQRTPIFLALASIPIVKLARIGDWGAIA